MKQKIISDHWGLMFPKDHYMFHAFNKKIVELVEAGIAKHILKITKKHPDYEDEVIDLEPKVLTMEHLGIWFLILTGLLGISLLCFFVEFISKFCHFRRKKGASKKSSSSKVSQQACGKFKHAVLS